ncbi:MAG: nickel-dependent hydrogenase large subunit, partial [Pirellulales bacterium]|nr:nickel-dependent hydrogenase large subunit [Pirellulales bacterium]
MAATHYLQALEVQRTANRIVSILGAKTPHIQNLTPGGVTNAINMDSQSTLTLERLWAIKALIDQLGDFINNAMMPDVAAVGALYADWTGHGAGVMNYLSVPDLPLDETGSTFSMPGGWIPGGDLAAFRPIPTFQDEFFRAGVKEAVNHSWYSYAGAAGGLHPFEGETSPGFTDFQDDGKYSWIKAPRWRGHAMEVGPLSRYVIGYAQNNPEFKEPVDKLLKDLGLPLKAIFSTLGRTAAR